MQWEQRPVGPSCLPAEPDELISKQNSQDSVKEFVIWLITMKCQMILIMRIEILEIHFYSVVLKMFENLYSIVCIMSAFPPFLFMLIFFFFASSSKNCRLLLKTQSLCPHNNGRNTPNSSGLGSRAVGSSSVKRGSERPSRMSVFQSVQWGQYFPELTDR